MVVIFRNIDVNCYRLLTCNEKLNRLVYFVYCMDLKNMMYNKTVQNHCKYKTTLTQRI